MTAVLVSARLEVVVSLTSALVVGGGVGWWLRGLSRRMRGVEG